MPVVIGLQLLDVDSPWALGSLLDVKRHLRAIGEPAIAVGDDRAVMDEQVAPRIIGLDETRSPCQY